jgi:competence protein ComEC
MASLQIYLLNVGQADTSIIKTPAGNVIVIDAVRPKKVKAVLQALQLPHGEIAHLIVTHPHTDHYQGVETLLKDFQVRRVTLAPFWQEPGPPGYHVLINKMNDQGISIRFLSGYERTVPDGGTFPEFKDKPVLELLGPSNNALEMLLKSGVLTPNHLSIISRLTYGKFSMVFAGDAQMENWAHFDQEGLLEKKCDIVRAAHHGSKRGSQWERLERLSPSLIVVSSDPDAEHNLPDAIGSAIFLELSKSADRQVALTRATGTIKIEAPGAGGKAYTALAYGEGLDDNPFANAPHPLPATDWAGLVRKRLA